MSMNTATNEWSICVKKYKIIIFLSKIYSFFKQTNFISKIKSFRSKM